MLANIFRSANALSSWIYIKYTSTKYIYLNMICPKHCKSDESSEVAMESIMAANFF